MELYGEQRTHFSLGIEHVETLLMTFHNKKVPGEIMKDNPT